MRIPAKKWPWQRENRMRLQPWMNQSRRWVARHSARAWAQGTKRFAQARELLEWVVPEVEACRNQADALRAQNPHLTDRQLAFKHLRGAQKRAARVGGATGLLANPLAMVPAAIGDAAFVLKLEGQLAGELAAILKPDSLADPEAFRADVLSVVFPAVASQAMRALTGIGAEQLTRALVQRAASRELTETTAKLALRRLGAGLAERTLTHAVPLLGVGLGAGWNWVEVGKVGRRAIAYYMPPP
jgi:hypothetical protein